MGNISPLYQNKCLDILSYLFSWSYYCGYLIENQKNIPMEIKLTPPTCDLVFNNVLRGFASEGFLPLHTRLVYPKIKKNYYITLAKFARSERTEISQPSARSQNSKHEHFKNPINS